jgi:hypothetical protein
MSTTITALAAWLLTAMQAFYSPSYHAATEAGEITEARYEAFAHDVAFASMQPYVMPVFDTRDGVKDDAQARAKTALVFVSIASYESRYKASVLSCKEGGDGNRSWGPFQTQRKKRLACKGALGAMVVGLEMVHESFRICHYMRVDAWLSEYTDGNQFRTSKAWKRSALRMNQALDYWKAHPFIAPAPAPEILPAGSRPTAVNP